MIGLKVGRSSTLGVFVNQKNAQSEKSAAYNPIHEPSRRSTQDSGYWLISERPENVSSIRLSPSSNVVPSCESKNWNCERSSRGANLGFSSNGTWSSKAENLGLSSNGSWSSRAENLGFSWNNFPICIRVTNNFPICTHSVQIRFESLTSAMQNVLSQFFGLCKLGFQVGNKRWMKESQETPGLCCLVVWHQRWCCLWLMWQNVVETHG